MGAHSGSFILIIINTVCKIFKVIEIHNGNVENLFQIEIYAF